jgi:MFS transporter, AAHS family, 3-hydroxyphenylpropionic acid transporter
MDDIRKELTELKTVQVVAICFLVIMLEGFDIQAAGVTMRKLATEFQLDKLQMGYFASSSAVGVLLFAAIGGILADRFGRKSVLIAATALFGLACLFTPSSSGFWTLLVARFVTGAGLGAAMPVVIAMTSDHSPTSQKKRYVGIVYCAISLGGMLCAAIMATGWLGSDWRPIYYVGGVLPIAVAIAMFAYLPASRPKSAEATDAAGVEGDWSDIVGVSKLPLTLTLWLATFLTLAVMYLCVLWMPTLLQARGFSPTEALIIQTMYNLGSTVAAVIVGYLLDKRMAYGVATAGYVLLALGLYFLGVAALSLAFGMTTGFVVGVGVATGQTLLYAFAPLCYPAAVRNRGVGCAVAAGRLGTIVGPMFAGVLQAAGLSAGMVLVWLIPAVAVALAACLAVARMLHGGDAYVAATPAHA